MAPAHAVISNTLSWNHVSFSAGIMTVPQVSLMSLTMSYLQSRQNALFPSHTYFCSLPLTPHPGHCLCVLPHLTSHILHQCHAAVLYFCLSPHSYYPAQLSLSHLSHSLCFHVPGIECHLHFLSLPPASSLHTLSSLQKPMCQVGRQFFDSSTLSAKCIQI